MANDDKTGDLIRRGENAPVVADERDIVLGSSNVLSTHGLDDRQIQELRMLHAKGMIDLDKKALEIGIDVQALDQTLSTMAHQTEQVSKAGDSVTTTHSQDSRLGRTEVIMGNTEAAVRGKLTKSQTGEDDNTLKYVIIGAVVVIVVAMIAFNG